MKRSLFTTLAAAAAFALAGSAAHAQRDLTVVSWGGAYQDGQKEVFFKPFNATGTRLVDESWDGGLGVLRHPHQRVRIGAGPVVDGVEPELHGRTVLAPLHPGREPVATRTRLVRP